LLVPCGGQGAEKSTIAQGIRQLPELRENAPFIDDSPSELNLHLTIQRINVFFPIFSVAMFDYR
jgi:hypothetical protein